MKGPETRNGEAGPGAGVDRRQAMARILAGRGQALLVTGLGSTSYDAAAAGDDPCNFYLWGAMGGASALGLGIALAQPQRRVLVITGDGEMLMGLGSLATIAARRPDNLCIVVFDNERYGETGAQFTHTRHGVDLSAMAAAAGFGVTHAIASAGALERALDDIHVTPGPVFVNLKVRPDRPPMVLPARDGAYLKNRFRLAVLGEP